MNERARGRNSFPRSLFLSDLGIGIPRKKLLAASVLLSLGLPSFFLTDASMDERISDQAPGKTIESLPGDSSFHRSLAGRILSRSRALLLVTYFVESPRERELLPYHFL